MSELHNKLKHYITEARTNRQKQLLEFYTTFLGECETKSKGQGREINDALIIEVGTSWRKNAITTLSIMENEADIKGYIAKVKKELSLLDNILPPLMDEDELSNIIWECKLATPDIKVGGVMKYLKDNHNGQYDGMIASRIVKEVLCSI